MSNTFIPAWTDTEGIERVTNLFSTTFTNQPRIVAAAPGRVNLIGEHTDYNDGLCLPIALPHRTFIGLTPREDTRVRLISDHGSAWEGDISQINPDMPASWVNYAGGPAWSLNITHGFDAAFVSCVPLGAGLSSSAAIECASAIALSDASKEEIVAACIRAENEIAHAPTGGMDQTVSVFGQEDHAVFIDFHDHSQELVSASFTEYGLDVLVIDTRAKHSLADGQYGNRRAECDQARDLLGLSSLRQATLDHLPQLPDLLAQRVRHVITENARVCDAITALRAQDFTTLGQLFTRSHESLRDDFEVSCAELDCVVEASLESGALGARMTGGGFGGSAIALIADEHIDDAIAHISAQAQAQGFPQPAFLRAHASNGAMILHQ